MKTMGFKNRQEAGRQLGAAPIDRGDEGEDTLVLGIPPGGLVAADERRSDEIHYCRFSKTPEAEF